MGKNNNALAAIRRYDEGFTTLRHKNGGGQVSERCEVDSASFVSTDSIVKGQGAWIRDTRIEDSTVISSLITNAELEKSMAMDSNIHGYGDGRLVLKYVCAEESYITGQVQLVSTCLVRSMISDKAITRNATVIDSVIYGDAQLLGDEFNMCRIGYGVWETAPQTLAITKHGADIVLTQSTEGHVYIGCRRKRAKTWLRHADKLRNLTGWDDDMLAQARDFLQQFV